jgi:hypothetical protein
VVPALSVRVTPGLVVVPAAGGAVERTISVSVTSGAKARHGDGEAGVARGMVGISRERGVKFRA